MRRKLRVVPTVKKEQFYNINHDNWKVSPMSTETPFVAFPKIPRWRRDIIITEKIDGTNAQIYILEDPTLPILAGSRNRWVTPEHDNYGWGAWVAAHAEELRSLGPGHHYGEWFGVGIQRGYGLFERRFALFNTSRWNEKNPPPACCTTVPVLTIGSNNERTIESCLERLRTEGSVAVSGFMRPEGIVVFHGASGRSFKILLEGDERPKGQPTE
jgi:hypothetical protein